MDRNFIAILIIGLFGVIVWVGFSIYFESTTVEPVSNTATYVVPISRSFNKTELDKVMNRVDQNLPIKPQEIRSSEQELK